MTEEERRALVLDALSPGANKTELAKRYGVSRQRIHQILDEERDDAGGKLRAAEDELLAAQEELKHRRHVLTLRQQAYQSHKDRS
jgi:transposase-like protein